MQRFRKKPVVIEAVQWKGFELSYQELLGLMGKEFVEDKTCFTDKGEVEISTLEGTMTASVNDWIIKGVNGEFYPCKPDIFEKTYERAETFDEIRDNFFNK
jgi:hypothetical protein